ncbi:MAG: helix-turn-helix domain-containing protein, partial [Bacteroidota bacterium]
GYYADKLFVSPKHLSEVSKQVSGRNALYWINRLTTIHIRKLLQQKTHSITELTDLFGFSSTAYFSRFVQQHLGVSPSEFYQ